MEFDAEPFTDMAEAELSNVRTLVFSLSGDNPGARYSSM
jgi:hypothetical protein